MRAAVQADACEENDMTDTFSRTQLLAEIRPNEGYRRQVYDDATSETIQPNTYVKGWASVGIGRNLVGKGLSDAEVMFLWDNDVDDIAHYADIEWPWWRQMSDARQRAFINLCFTGVGTIGTFTTFLGLLESGQYGAAADDLQGTLYARQLPGRAKQIADLIRAG